MFMLVVSYYISVMRVWSIRLKYSSLQSNLILSTEKSLRLPWFGKGITESNLLANESVENNRLHLESKFL